MKNEKYAGFWIRAEASLIDTLITILIFLLLFTILYNPESGNFYIINFLPAMIVLAFWFSKSATPGKMATKLIIVDAKTGEKPTIIQFLLRYFGYFLSSFFLLGFIWVALDKRKQGWHDKIAGTVVIKKSNIEKVKFEYK